LSFKGGQKSKYPGVGIKPASGASWDCSAYGHIEVKVTNTGTSPATLTLRVDNAGDWQDNPWNVETLRDLQPGESKILKVVFGYQYGLNPGYKLNAAAITRVLLFAEQPKQDCTLRLGQIVAAGPAGEKPPVNPASIRTVPDKGVILAKNVAIDSAKQIQTSGGAKASVADGALRIDFQSAKEQTVTGSAGDWLMGSYSISPGQNRLKEHWPNTAQPSSARGEQEQTGEHDRRPRTSGSGGPGGNRCAVCGAHSLARRKGGGQVQYDFRHRQPLPQRLGERRHHPLEQERRRRQLAGHVHRGGDSTAGHATRLAGQTPAGGGKLG
jgi:hypothetical protein